MRAAGLGLVSLLLCTTVCADGEMVLGGRVLFRQGAPADVCREHGRECDTALGKILSGYGYLRGHLIGAIAAELQPSAARPFGAVAAQLSAASAALPGGDLTLGRVDGVLAGSGDHRLRLALAEAEGLFFCHDVRTGRVSAPLLGMTAHHCAPDAMLAIDARVAFIEWHSAQQLKVEWFSLGPALELLSNGLGYAHVGRSVQLGVNVDLQTQYELGNSRPSRTSLGGSVRLGVLWRSPRWEVRLRARQRTVLVGGAGLLGDNTAAGQLYLLHNFLLHEALLVQAGLTGAVSYSQNPGSGFELWTPNDQRWGGWLGVYLGWVSAAPDI